MKISLLEKAINPTLNELLLNKSLPDDDYTKWITKVKRVASRLENTPKYRPQGRSGKKTWYLAQTQTTNDFISGGSRTTNTSKIDADGDTRMEGLNTAKIAQVVINTLSGGNEKQIVTVLK